MDTRHVFDSSVWVTSPESSHLLGCDYSVVFDPIGTECYAFPRSELVFLEAGKGMCVENNKLVGKKEVKRIRPPPTV